MKALPMDGLKRILPAQPATRNFGQHTPIAPAYEPSAVKRVSMEKRRHDDTASL
jgi:hypothetical protein